MANHYIPKQEGDNIMAENYSLYKQATVPDKTVLGELLVSAKGPGRTMRQFANEIGTSPATLSRLANGKNRGASNPALLAAIAEHADSESGISYEQLMEANGMVKKRKDADQKIHGMDEKMAKRIILTELFERGYRLEQYCPVYIPISPEPSSFALKTNTLCEDDSDTFWAFVQYQTDNPNIANLLCKIMTEAVNAVADPDSAFDKLSFIIDDYTLFAEIERATADIQIESEISVILVNEEELRVVDEIVFPNNLGTSKKVFAAAE